VAGTVGAGGNAGAVAAGFLFKSDMAWNDAFLVIGIVVTCASVLPFLVRFSPQQEEEERALFEAAQIDALEMRAAHAVERLKRSREIVDEYNKTHGDKVHVPHPDAV
jgi:NNP family nitrate/nitrite transporter-like MFS transporter